MKPIIVFDGKAPDLKRRTLIERFRQRYAGEKNYKKMAQRLVMNVLERRPKRPSSGSVSQGDDPSQGSNPYSTLTQAQEANILQLLEEYENAMEEREIEEVFGS